MDIQNVTEKISNANMVLIGIGEEFSRCEKNNLAKAYSALSGLLKNKNYYMITIGDEEEILHADFLQDRICRPLSYGDNPEEHPDWIRYTKWLQGTLNRDLLVLELGVGLQMPGIIRFPFEKVTFFNAKANMIRIHEHLHQIPEELSGKAASVAMNAPQFLMQMNER